MTAYEAPEEPDNADVSRVLLSRRRLLTMSGLAVAGAGLTGLGASSASAGVSHEPAVSAAEAARMCGLTAEQPRGPYYIDGMLRRRDIVEDRVGVPLTLNLRVIDGRTCRPLQDVAVEIWHCDAEGLYSGYTAIGPADAPTGPPPSGAPGGGPTPTDDLTFLRGLQLTNRQGMATFQTIVPGWYIGRAVHIHTKVHTDGTATATGYTGGRTCHTGQLYFDEALVTRLYQVDPYRGNATARTTLEGDPIYADTGAPGGLLDLRYDPNRLNRGVSARLTLGVNPEATNNGDRQPGAARPPATPAGPLPGSTPTSTPTPSSTPSAG